MPFSIEQLISKLPSRTPPDGMFEMIQCGINHEKNLRSIKRKALAFGSGLITLSIFMAIFWNILWQEIAQSAFAVYLQTVLSDPSLLLAYWREAAMSLLETLPVANLIAWLLMVFFALGLISKLWQITKYQAHNHRHPALT